MLARYTDLYKVALSLVATKTAKWCFFCFVHIAVYCALPLRWSQAYTRMHHLDVWELRHNTIEALWNLNCQPPLYNAWIACVAKLFPDSLAGIVCQLQYFALSILTFHVFLKLITRFRVNNTLATILTYAYTLMPTLLYAERWLTYTFPVGAILLIAFYLLLRWHEDGYRHHLYGYFLCLLVIVLTRSLYHPVVWLVPCSMFAIRRKHVHNVFLIALPVTILALIPNFLNLSRYGMFTNSTWQGMNLFRTMQYVTRAEKEQEIAKGNVSRIVMLAPIFEKDEIYLEYLGDRIPKSGIAVLDIIEKSSSDTDRTGERNSNALFMIELSKDYQKSWLYLVKKYPCKYLASVATSLYEFFSIDIYRNWNNRREWLPQTENHPLTFTIRAIRAIILPTFILVAFTISLIGYLKIIVAKDGKKLPAMFAAYTLCMTAGIASLCEAGETSIMRVSIEPLIVVGIALALSPLLQNNHRGLGGN